MSRDSSFPRLEVPRSGDLQPSLLRVGPADRQQSSPTSVWSARIAPLLGSVWLLPLLKLLGFCCVLTCIAWLGERSRDESIYGPELAAKGTSPSPEAPPSDPNVADARKEVGASTPPPAPAPPPPPPCAPAPAATPAAAPVSALLADGRLVLNEASVQELDRLPGIGQKRAEDIVALRTRLGRFKKATDLLRIRGIGPRSLASLQEHLVLDRPASPVASTPPAGETKQEAPARAK